MHLVCLGVVRKLLNFWLSGDLHAEKGKASRLPARAVRCLSERLMTLRNSVPREFARKPRSVNEIDRWKATEFRTLLLYTGPVVLSGILKSAAYNNFIQLSTAISLLASPLHCMQYNKFANDLLVDFVKQCFVMYGPSFVVYNVHALVHLAADVQKFGPLDSFSAFPFENELQGLKRMVRSGNMPLSQIIRRTCEKRQFTQMLNHPVDTKVLSEHFEGPCPEGFEMARQFSKFQKPGMFLSTSLSDGCIAIEQQGVFFIRNILQLKGKIYLACEAFSDISTLDGYPLLSSSIGIVCVSNLCGSITVFPPSTHTRKCVCLPHSSITDCFVVIPLWHSP